MSDIDGTAAQAAVGLAARGFRATLVRCGATDEPTVDVFMGAACDAFGRLFPAGRQSAYPTGNVLEVAGGRRT